MSIKLTLTLDEKVIERAKQYARLQGRSLSNLIEDYLKALTDERRDKSRPEPEPTPKTDSLLGILRPLGADFDERKALEDVLAKKYLPHYYLTAL